MTTINNADDLKPAAVLPIANILEVRTGSEINENDGSDAPRQQIKLYLIFILTQLF
jgi:hypothetical protein